MRKRGWPVRYSVKIDNGKKADSIFNDAIELAINDRDIFIRNACLDNPWLLDEVNSLVRTFETCSGFLDDSGLELGLQVLGSEEPAFLGGDMIGHFRVERLLGVGGMGSVYLAEDTKLKRLVALKLLNDPFHDDERVRKQMLKEASATASLEHPNICSIYSAEKIGDHHVIVMQYIEGRSLSRLLREEELEQNLALSIFTKVAEAIRVAHNAGIIHCDIKPGNIMMAADGSIKVLDFGLAKFLRRPQDESKLQQSQASQSGLIEGTVAYMSPEQLKRERLDRRTDIFSLGTILFELITQMHPFERDTDAETIAAVISNDSPINRSAETRIPSHLKPVLRKCLQTDRELRYQNVDELLSDLSQPRSISIGTGKITAVLISALILILGFVGYSMIFCKVKTYKIAVLPFKNELFDTSFDYITDGLTEGVVNKLSAFSQLKTVPYSTVSGYRDMDSISAGKEVGAEILLTGKMLHQDDHNIVRTELLDVNTGDVISDWEDEVSPADALIFENMMTNRLISLLSIDNSGSTASKRRGSTTENAEAFRQFLIGRHYWKKRDEENLKTAIAAFQDAIDLDPGFSRPYAGLADSYVLMSLAAYGSIAPNEAMSKAKAAAKQALEIDPYNAEAHTSLGVILTKCDWDWTGAERELRLAGEMDPDYAAAHYWLSDLLAVTGKAEESITEATRARELDPFSQQTEMNLARTYYYARQYDKALAVLDDAKRDGPAERKIRYMKGLVFIQKGMYREALQILQDISNGNKLFAAAERGYAYAKLGMRKEAIDVIHSLQASNKDSVPSEEIAFIYTGLGDKDHAFFYLNEAFKVRHAVLIALKVEPLFDPIREDERFVAILHNMGLS